MPTLWGTIKPQSLSTFKWCEIAGRERCVFAVKSPTFIPFTLDCMSVKSSVCRTGSASAVKIGLNDSKISKSFFTFSILSVSASVFSIKQENLRNCDIINIVHIDILFVNRYSTIKRLSS